MQTKDDLIMYVVNAHVMAGQKNDAEKKTGYGDRFLKASKIVLTDGVKTTSHGEYEVHSGTDAGIMYHVNGTCECQDWKNWVHHERWLKDQVGKDVTSFAPKGFCKHRIAVVINGKVQARLKWTVEQSIVHPHRWTCEIHRQVPIECWQHACPDPERLPCPTCSASEKGAPVQEFTMYHPEQQAQVMEEACQTILDAQTIDMVTGEVLGESMAQEQAEPPVTGLSPSAGMGELSPLVLSTSEYEPAPVLAPVTYALPEAAASLNIKLRMENAEIMMTMRAHTDSEVLERLPNVLATLERLMKTEVDHNESFMRRLLHAFFPKPSKYTGK